MKIKAISIKQPWAWLIVNGPKDIENRNWHTRYRGLFAVHASLGFDDFSYDELVEFEPELGLPAKDEFPRGGIVGFATLVNCVTSHPSRWFEGDYGFVLQDRRPCDFMPLKGRLGFFDVEVPDECLR